MLEGVAILVRPAMKPSLATGGSFHNSGAPHSRAIVERTHKKDPQLVEIARCAPRHTLHEAVPFCNILKGLQELSHNHVQRTAPV